VQLNSYYLYTHSFVVFSTGLHMNRFFSATTKRFLLFIVLLVLFLIAGNFVVPQQSKLRPVLKSKTTHIPTVPSPIPFSTQPIQRIAAADEPWDKNLVLPDTSDRLVHYTMDVQLDADKNVIYGWEIVEWRNETGKPQQNFPFHLYHNAWKNTQSTFAKENEYNLEQGITRKDFGYTNIKKAIWYSSKGEIDITPSCQYIQPDDNNINDQTVCMLSTPQSILPRQNLKLKLEFETKQPLPIARTGAIRDYHFVAQWFPKIGVWWKNAWNCHQFHARTEFFSDYGVYDVKITVPYRYIVGASGGIPKSHVVNNNNTTTYQFVQEDIHDFVWVTAPDLILLTRKFSHIHQEPDEQSDRHHPLKEVAVLLFLQPHHTQLADRYFDATFKALRYYGEWYGEYPYSTITVVDPAYGSSSGGMEYPTLFTGGTTVFAPREESSPEGVTVHEFGHQFWYGLVGTNEFEEAWLDEGFTTYSTDRVMRAGWKPFKQIIYYFGQWGSEGYNGLPFAIHEVDDIGLLSRADEIRRQGKNDIMTRLGWQYNRTYGLNSYTKPALSLMMLERYLGEEYMYRIMRTYHFRYRFKHPTSQNFIDIVNTVSGRNMDWFFQNTWFSSDVFDYSVDRITNLVPTSDGIFNINGGPDDTLQSISSSTMFECEVVIKREGEAIAPVDVLVTFKNGNQIREQWDGQYRWKKFFYQSDSPIASALVDPDHKLVLDINWNNNSKVVRPSNFVSMASLKYASKFMFWMQNFIDLMSFGL
jgi:hypothetical protein